MPRLARYAGYRSVGGERERESGGESVFTAGDTERVADAHADAYAFCYVLRCRGTRGDSHVVADNYEMILVEGNRRRRRLENKRLAARVRFVNEQRRRYTRVTSV